jgi:hypothetical protein
MSSIDGFNRSASLYTGTLDPNVLASTAGTQGAKGAQGTDPNALLQAQRALLGNSSNPADGLDLPGDTKVGTANLAGLTENQVTADIFAFMALFQKLAQEMRNTARTQRTAESQAQITSLQNAAEKMKDAAAQRLTAAIVQGAMQIAGGLLQAGLSAASATQTIKGAKMEADGTKNLAQIDQMGTKGMLSASSKTALSNGATDQVAAGKALGAQGTLYAGLGQASSGITGGLGGIIGASFTHKADLADAEKMNLETQAKVQETAVQHANDMMQQMMDVIRDVRDKLQSIQQSAIETNRGISRNI